MKKFEYDQRMQLIDSEINQLESEVAMVNSADAQVQKNKILEEIQRLESKTAAMENNLVVLQEELAQRKLEKNEFEDWF